MNLIESLEGRRLLCDPSTLDASLMPVWSDVIERVVDSHRAQHSANGDGGGSATSDAGVSLVWTNRGSSVSDTDKFNQVFGTVVDPATNLTKADEARKVIDQVLLDWAKAIVSFNRSDGTTTLQMTVTMNTATNNNNAAAAPASTAPSDGMPRTGSVSINAGNDGHGSGYYVDTNPSDYSEFNSVTQNAFSGFPTANLGADLYSLVSLEVTHVLGIIAPQTGTTGWSGYKYTTSGLATKSTASDTAEGVGTGVFGVFNGATIKHLMTTNNGGSSGNGGIDWGSLIHTAGASGRVAVQAGDARYQPVTIGGTVYYPDDDTGNAVYETPRLLPNEVVLDILHDAYGYSVQDPHTLPNYFANLNTSTHVLHVTGALGGTVAGDLRNTSNDVITVDQSGSAITVSVNIGNDTPASGNLPGAGDLAAYVSTFDASQVNSIVIDGQGGSDTIVIRGIKPTTINGGDGDDNIRVHGVATGSGNTVVVNGGNGNDSISFGTTEPTLNDLNNFVTVNGGAGTDTLRFDDDGEQFADTYTIFGSSFSRTSASGSVAFNEFESLLVNSGNGASTFNVNAIPTGMTYTINAGGGADTVNVGNHDITGIFGSLVVHGGGNGDRLMLDDLNANTGHTYTLNSTTLRRTDLSNNVAFDGIAVLAAAGGSGSDTFNVTPDSFIAFSVNGNSPSVAPGDTLNLALAGVTGASNNSSGTGTWTFSNRASVQYFSIETQTSTGTNVAPTIGSLIGPSGTVATNSSFNLSATGVSDPDGNLTGVRFYRETNGSSGLQVGSDTLESTVNVGSGGTYSTTLATTGFPPGVYTYYAAAYDAAAATSAPATTIVTVGVANQPPVIAGGLLISPNPVTVGDTFYLFASSVSDPDGNLGGVNFYRETNGVSGLQAGSDTLVANDNYGPDGYQVGYSSGSMAAGTYTFYAQAYDALGATSAVYPSNVSVTSPPAGPSISALYVIPGSVAVNSTFALIAGTITDPSSTVTAVHFYRESNGVAGLQLGSDTDLGTDTVSNDGWALGGIAAGSVAGTFTCYATATNANNVTGAAASSLLTVTADSPPTVSNPQFAYDVAPLRVNMTFSQDVGASLSATDMSVINLANNAPVAVDSVIWNGATKVASFILHGVPADGNYRATLFGAGVTSAAGTPVAGNTTLDFFTLAGDANHNRKVDFDDLVILAQNYNLTGRTFSQGDFTYDGKVDFDDLVIMAQKYNTTQSLQLLMPGLTQPALKPGKPVAKRPVAEIVI